MANAPGQSISVDKNCPVEVRGGRFLSVEMRASQGKAVKGG